MNKRGDLIVALDVATFEKAKELVDILGDQVNIYKVGSQLFTACGPAVVHYLMAQGKKVFLDLKFHDIPNTVANAVSAAVSLNQNGPSLSKQSLFMCTLHTVGGEEMLKRAAKAAQESAQKIGVPKPFLLGITVLTSQKKDVNIGEIVLRRVALAKQCGLDGVVASSQEVKRIRQEFGESMLIVTPGIRPQGADAGDQKRVATPLTAISDGSDYLVVGRPIVKADNPLESAKNILHQIKRAQDAV